MNMSRAQINGMLHMAETSAEMADLLERAITLYKLCGSPEGPDRYTTLETTEQAYRRFMTEQIKL